MPGNVIRRRALAAISILAAIGAAVPLAQAESVLRIAMTATDVPTPHGIPNNGGEGYRFMGYTAYDSLVNWDYTRTDELADLAPGLAEKWEIDPSDNKRWLFHLRKGVTFHDGTPFDADAVIFNLQRVYDDKSPQYDGPSASVVRGVASMLKSWEKVDADTVAITTSYPFSPFPYLLTRLLIASPTQFAKSGSWVEFSKTPAGTGPFRIGTVDLRVSAELFKNPGYWDKTRIPKVDKILLLPIPEPMTRMSALLAGRVDWIEVPPADGLARLKQAGFQISLKPYPHIWPYELNAMPGSPFANKLVRQAANYAVDRDSIVKLLNGSAAPAQGVYPPENALFGAPENRYSYNPEKAKELLKQAGLTLPVKAKIMISTSGSGQMLPLPMNELIQQSMAAAGFQIEFEVAEWGTLLVALRGGPKANVVKGADAINVSLSFTDPSSLFREFHSSMAPPAGWNWGFFQNPTIDELLAKSQVTFEAAPRNELLKKAHAMIVDEAAWLFIVHDLNPRALSPKVKGFRPAQSWYQDLTQVSVE